MNDYKYVMCGERGQLHAVCNGCYNNLWQGWWIKENHILCSVCYESINLYYPKRVIKFLDGPILGERESENTKTKRK